MDAPRTPFVCPENALYISPEKRAPSQRATPQMSGRHQREHRASEVSRTDLSNSRSSSREVRIRVPTFCCSLVGEPSRKKETVKGHLAGGGGPSQPSHNKWTSPQDRAMTHFLMGSPQQTSMCHWRIQCFMERLTVGGTW